MGSQAPSSLSRAERRRNFRHALKGEVAGGSVASRSSGQDHLLIVHKVGPGPQEPSADYIVRLENLGFGDYLIGNLRRDVRRRSRRWFTRLRG